MIGFGSQSSASCVIRAHVSRSFWLRRRSVIPRRRKRERRSSRRPIPKYRRHHRPIDSPPRLRHLSIASEEEAWNIVFHRVGIYV
jgi:hypothetical protein